MNDAEELHELDIFQLRDRVFDLEKQNKRLRRQLGKSRDKLARAHADLERQRAQLVKARYRIVRLQIVGPASDHATPVVTHTMVLRPGVADIVQLAGHVRPENPVLNGYFTMMNLQVTVLE